MKFVNTVPPVFARSFVIDMLISRRVPKWQPEVAAVKDLIRGIAITILVGI